MDRLRRFTTAYLSVVVTGGTPMGKHGDLHERAPRYRPVFTASPPGRAATSRNVQSGQLPTMRDRGMPQAW
jgi:hypothetical protein